MRVSSLRTGGALLQSAHHIGFTTYTFLKMFQGKLSEVHPRCTLSPLASSSTSSSRRWCIGWVFSPAKNAQTLSLVVILPLFGLIALQVLGVVLFTPLLMLAVAGVLAVVSYLLLRAAVALFKRETILVRWK